MPPRKIPTPEERAERRAERLRDLASLSLADVARVVKPGVVTRIRMRAHVSPLERRTLAAFQAMFRTLGNRFARALLRSYRARHKHRKGDSLRVTERDAHNAFVLLGAPEPPTFAHGVGLHAEKKAKKKADDAAELEPAEAAAAAAEEDPAEAAEDETESSMPPLETGAADDEE